MDSSRKDNPGQGHGNEDHGGGAGGQSQTTIIVNTREKTVEGKEVTYDQIVGLAFETVPRGENIEITVLYRDGPGQNKEGTLAPNGSVRIKKDMIFDVTATDKS